ncbi:Cytochrome c-like protein [Candidatus Sulfopaludibacter sp. SbA3]|nr:Cytochrome c-like protein [Candidatus Sulfopaludibacter sp. SbA3]
MLKKVVLIVGVVLIVAIAGGAAFLYLHQPAQAAPSGIKVAMTPERIARGKFLFENLCDCDGCNSQRDFSRVDGPVVAAGRGRGNELSAFLRGMPGTVVASNITPDPETGLGKWTDGEKIRAIREGVDNAGRALFPMMPYPSYRKMSDEDVQAVVAYMNSLPPIQNSLPATKLNFPVGLFIKFAPAPAGSVGPPDRADRLKYGEYLVTIGGCADCHTPLEKGQPVVGKTFAGGQVFASSAGTVVTANITPDMETGIGKWSEEYFKKKFYDYREYAASGPPPLPGPQAFTLMPWLELSQVPPEDLGAIYAWLRTVKPVHNAVEMHPGAPK